MENIAMTTEYLAYLRLSFSYGVGPVTFLKLLDKFGSAEEVFRQNLTTLSYVVQTKGVAQAILANQAEEVVAKSLAWVEHNPANRFIITLLDDDYPVQLAQTATPPIILFAEGRRELLENTKLAMVGTRHPTAQGIQTAQDFARELASNRITIVSGLAAGIDRCAHEGALAAKSASTIAVIGTGMDVIYPASNRKLHQQICNEGLVLSEYPLGTPPLNNNFPRRNRIVVGLSQACLVVESAFDGGSMISANFALEMGRDVLAIPGSIHNPMARGCHKLIKQGAKLCETAQDVLEELRITHYQSPRVNGELVIEEPLLVAIGFEPISIDSLCAKLDVEFSELCGQLLEYELEGKIVNCGGGRYQRVFR